ncbi:transposase, mutator type [Mycobacteroides abscessus subsp. abscessus]|nr:transposase, mutator type [Mycobacteroides abscessus subsp. abscessus]SHY70389.1 transposase, mutator type [Mycobacteroides abscessus subsp. abscessus]SIC41317.1 transposase, mutator type [Mycobacteroides abscessus subsp. abscessus]SID24262.1 transposase, mutator type [Mycobacteroides abscessus subsp. abscessus]SID40705.1 transposase, mutator type [Mycobacteroides abscessus subsp. abscessus]
MAWRTATGENGPELSERPGPDPDDTASLRGPGRGCGAERTSSSAVGWAQGRRGDGRQSGGEVLAWRRGAEGVDPLSLDPRIN